MLTAVDAAEAAVVVSVMCECEALPQMKKIDFLSQLSFGLVQRVRLLIELCVS